MLQFSCYKNSNIGVTLMVMAGIQSPNNSAASRILCTHSFDDSTNSTNLYCVYISNTLTYVSSVLHISFLNIVYVLKWI